MAPMHERRYDGNAGKCLRPGGLGAEMWYQGVLNLVRGQDHEGRGALWRFGHTKEGGQEMRQT